MIFKIGAHSNQIPHITLNARPTQTQSKQGISTTDDFFGKKSKKNGEKTSLLSK